MKHGLGRGLKELLGNAVEAKSPTLYDTVQNISLNDLQPNKHQPRQKFDDRSLYELAESIGRSGVIQPIIVRKEGEKYSIIAGERRFRASKIAGLNTIPAIIKNTSEQETMEYAIVENIQREDLGIIEEAESYQKLMKEFGYTQEELSNFLGKSRSHIANILRLNVLPAEVKELVNKHVLTMGHVKNLVGHKDAEEIASIIVYKGLNTRQAEQLVRNWGSNEGESKTSSKVIDQDGSEELTQLANSLSEKFNIKIDIESNGGSGKMTFHFSSMEQLDGIFAKLT